MGGCLAIALLMPGCDTVDGPPAIDAVPPVVAELEVTPRTADVDSLHTVGGEVTIPLSLVVRATPGDAPVERVAYAVRWQFECQASALDASGVMEPIEGGLYVASPDLAVPRGRRGIYRVSVWSVDAAGLPSNEAGATFELTGTNLGPPVIQQIVAPSSVTPPATLRFVVHVSDPDGIDNIARAEVDVPGAGTLPLAETDAAGNHTPCDGIYTAAFSVPPGIQPGSVPFTFRAFDRDGAVSESVTFTVQIQ
jgi:hypothetical protein